MSGVNPNDLDRRVAEMVSTSLVAVSGLDTDKLIQIGNYLNICQAFADRQEREIVVDYIPAVTEQAFLNDPDAMPARPVIVQPTQIAFRIEDHTFGGSTYAAITAEGLVIGGPFIWTTWEALAQTKLGGKPR